MRRIIAVAIIILASFLLQTTVLQWIPYLEITPNILLIVTLSFGFMRGRSEGLYVGFLCGLLMDLFYNKCLFTFLFKLLSSFVYRLDLLDYHLEQAMITLLVLDMAFH